MHQTVAAVARRRTPRQSVHALASVATRFAPRTACRLSDRVDRRGIEPRFRGCKPRVLPLNEQPIDCRVIPGRIELPISWVSSRRLCHWTTGSFQIHKSPSGATYSSLAASVPGKGIAQSRWDAEESRSVHKSPSGGHTVAGLGIDPSRSAI